MIKKNIPPRERVAVLIGLNRNYFIRRDWERKNIVRSDERSVRARLINETKQMWTKWRKPVWVTYEMVSDDHEYCRHNNQRTMHSVANERRATITHQLCRCAWHWNNSDRYICVVCFGISFCLWRCSSLEWFMRSMFVRWSCRLQTKSTSHNKMKSTEM